LYVREADVKASNLEMTYSQWEGLRQRKIGAHAYIRLDGATLSYTKFVVEGREVWYDILVPYQIEFDTDPADGQTVWANVALTNPPWGDAVRQITDPITAGLVQSLGFLAPQ
jgi:hypothetical protein